MIYIDKMVSWDWDMKEIRTDRMKIVIQEAAVLAKRRGTKQFLEGTREEDMRKEREEPAKIKWNGSAGVFHPRVKKEETKSHKQMEEGDTLGLYPRGVLMVINETKLSDKMPIDT